MSFDPERVDVRFGCGRSVSIAPPPSVTAMIDLLRGPDDTATDYPIPVFKDFLPTLHAIQLARYDKRKAKSGTARKASEKFYDGLRYDLKKSYAVWSGHMIQRRVFTRDGLRERLVAFWADHFTARGSNSVWYIAQLPYVEEAIRPHVNGRFSDMLRAVATQPLMLRYLDQTGSVGPNSPAGRMRGLNENLAREMLELHTLGVDGPYTQKDVREFAELLTGLTFNMRTGFAFRPDFAEPGPENMLGE